MESEGVLLMYQDMYERWLAAELDDAGQVYWPCTAANGQQESGKPARFVAFAGFEGENLVHNPELTPSV